MREQYLVEADLRRVPSLSTDVLVIGAGAAALRAALAASSQGASVLVVAKRGLADSNTALAQGGIAAALGPDDSPELHLRDTVEAGAGLTDEAAARKVVHEGPERVKELLDWGAAFDRAQSGELAFTREAAHSRSRVLHAHGDATGREIARTLIARARADANVTIMERCFCIDLMHSDGRVYGALLAPRAEREGAAPELLRVESRSTILATGGAGRLFRETTNPEVATGDGLAMAYRAGAALADLEFVQFHPTALYVAGAPRMLISEAVRGEGAYLLNTRRERFMQKSHPDGELAPRDVVSAAIVEEMARTRSPHVYLDLRHLDPALVRRRFPQIADVCAMYGLVLTQDLIPVRPAAHYMMGGVLTGLDARTTLDGLWACGEVACTGLHGANRLASNSLLEALVFGKTAGDEAASSPGKGRFPDSRVTRRLPRREVEINLDDMRQSIQSLMTRQAGIFREADELASALRALGHWQDYVYPSRFLRIDGFEVQNMLTAATLVVRGALMREESRGAHRRRDFPGRDDARWKRRIIQSRKDFGG